MKERKKREGEKEREEGKENPWAEVFSPNRWGVYMHTVRYQILSLHEEKEKEGKVTNRS
jgi:hypothetical protein